MSSDPGKFPELFGSMVFNEETMKKLLLSCHIAGLTGATFARGYRMLWENIDRCERGEKPFPIVN